MNITLPFIILGLIIFSINNYKKNKSFSLDNINIIYIFILLILSIGLIYRIHNSGLTKDNCYEIPEILLILSIGIYSLTKKVNKFRKIK